MNFHPTNDNRDQLEQALVAVRIEMERSPVLAEQSQASALLAQRGRTVGSIPATGASNADRALDDARLAMMAAMSKTYAHRIRWGYADHEDLEARAEHIQIVLNAAQVYASAVVEDTARNSAYFDNAEMRRAVERLREAVGYFHDAVGDLLGPMVNAAEECAEDRDQ